MDPLTFYVCHKRYGVMPVCNGIRSPHLILFHNFPICSKISRFVKSVLRLLQSIHEIAYTRRIAALLNYGPSSQIFEAQFRCRDNEKY